jgi:putative transposase
VSNSRYHHQWRTHLSLDKDAPQSRNRQQAWEGPVVEIREVGGLHHHDERRAA